MSHQTSQILVDGHFHPAEKHQLQPTKHFQNPRYQLIALLEPGTEEYGYIDRGLRDHGITSGSIDVTDADALKTLDIIVAGHAYAVTTRVLDAITQAVESGVGLFHEGSIGSVFPGKSDPKVCRLLLTDRMSFYHTPGEHHLPLAATVVATHPILAGVPIGSELQVAGCAPVFVPTDPSAKVLMYHDDPITPQNPATPDMPEFYGLRCPCLMVGKIGQGRVALVAIRWPEPVQALPGLRGNFIHNVFDWLAEERIAERQFYSEPRPSGSVFVQK